MESNESQMEVFSTTGVYEFATTGATNSSNTTERVSVEPWDDATWILTSAFIIFTMQSGFGLLESGIVSAKNEVNIMVKNVIDVLFGGLSYWIIGYGLCFGKSHGSNVFVGIGHYFVDITNINTEDTGYLLSHFLFHASFATTATTIVSGAVAGRTKLESYIVFSFFYTFIYCIPARWVWSSDGWLSSLHFLDIAGAGPVHLMGGMTGLIAAIMLGPRHGRFDDGYFPASSPTNAIFGLFMLWWGWFGFNCGSTLGIRETRWILTAISAVSTLVASICGGITGVFLSYVTLKRTFDVTYIVNGVLASLVAITAYCALAKPWEAAIIGTIGGAIGVLIDPLVVQKLRIDDPVGVVSVHFFPAIWGLLSVGIFGRIDHYSDQTDMLSSCNGLLAGGGFYLLGIQALGLLVIAVWTGITSVIFLGVIYLTIGLRMPLHEELLGADLVEHSIGGSYVKTTGEWFDENHKLVLRIDKSPKTSKEDYDQLIRQIKVKVKYSTQRWNTSKDTTDSDANSCRRNASFGGVVRGVATTASNGAIINEGFVHEEGQSHD